MSSSHYTILTKNIQEVDTLFRTFNKEDSSLPQNQQKLRALISLIHAELESYFELLAHSVIDRYENNLLKQKRKNKLIDAMLHYSVATPFSGEQQDKQHRITNSIRSYKTFLTLQNNGIKEKDVLKILLPVGLPLKEIDTVWLSTLNSFGAFRGELMHNNINQIKKYIGYNYIDENIYKIILPGLFSIDKYFSEVYEIS